MAKDFTANVEKPLWALSSYGPAKYEPTLISNLDESPEELRLKALVAVQSGASIDYVRRTKFQLSFLALS